MIKVIIVEDEENIRKSIEYMVDWDKCGCVVAGTASNGKLGLQLIKKIKPDIVISDIRMPFLSGLKMIESASEFDAFESIIISGYSDFEYAKKAINLSVNNYILKPIDYKELEDSLCKLTKYIHVTRESKKEETLVYYSQKMKEIIEYIDNNLESKLSLGVICDEFDISSTSLNNLFKQEISTTVNDYINQTKIKRSIELMKSEKYMVYEIAEMLGFSNYKYFSQVFKKYTKKSPTEFFKTNWLLKWSFFHYKRLYFDILDIFLIFNHLKVLTN